MDRKDRIKNHVNGIYSEFKREERLPVITDSHLISETDGSFIQIGQAILLDSHLFEPNEPELYGLEIYGLSIARGEVNYLAHYLESEVEPIDCKNEFDINFFVKELLNLVETTNAIEGDIAVLSSVSTKHFLYNNHQNNLFGWSTSKNAFVLNLNGMEIPIYYFLDKEKHKKKLIVYNKNFVRLNTKIQKKFESNELTRLFVGVEEKSDKRKTRFEIKTVIKLELKEKKAVKIFSNLPE